MIESGAPRHSDEWALQPDGTRVLFDTLKAPLRSSTGTIVGVIGVARDVTERKMAEEKLRDLSDRLRLALRAADVGIWEYDPATRRLTWDEGISRLYGLPLGDLEGTHERWEAMVHPDDVAGARRSFKRALRGEEDFSPQYRIIRSDGTIRHLEANAAIQRDEAGRPVRVDRHELGHHRAQAGGRGRRSGQSHEEPVPGQHEP